MTEQYFEITGNRVPSDQLQVRRAREFAQLIESGASPFAKVVECIQTESWSEYVVVEINPSLPQYPVFDIRRTERLSIQFRQEDSWYPDIRALRTDFPRERVLHINWTPKDEPASLCLFTAPWVDVRITLTANELLFRLQNWLEDTATNTLHRGDQPLEPAFLGNPISLIVSEALVESAFKQASQVTIGLIPNDGIFTLIEERPDRFAHSPDKKVLVVAAESEPHLHSELAVTLPRDLAELHEMLTPLGLDLRGKLQLPLLQHEKVLNDYAYLLLFLRLWRKRDESSAPVPELSAFLCIHSDGLRTLGKDIGLFDGGQIDPTKTGTNVMLDYVRVRFELEPETASLFSGNQFLDKPLVGIGAGAIGSQVIMTAARGGLARWHVVDSDSLQPHNLVRHALPAMYVGHPKAPSVAREINSLFQSSLATSDVLDILKSDKVPEITAKAIDGAVAIVDLSASVAVSKFLALDLEASAKRCSVFISPSGRDAVFLGESEDRSYRLDSIESQYYRAVAQNELLEGHLKGATTIGSCRDITTLMAQDLVGAHAALGTRALRTWLGSQESRAVVVRTFPETLSSFEINVPLGEMVVIGELGEWTVITDSLFLQTVERSRAEDLPNETGGVLLAHVDSQRKILYVCHQIPAPSDSEKQPTVYIRGSTGLKDVYERIRKQTLNGLFYIGEWHSHPDLAACSPSTEDVLAGAWLADEMLSSSLPGVMLIVGRDNQTCWMLCSKASDPDAIPTVTVTWNKSHE